MLFSFLLKLYKPMDMTEGEPRREALLNFIIPVDFSYLAPQNGLMLLFPP